MRWLRKSGPARLDFDFEPHPARMRPAGWLLWIVAIAFSADVGWSYVKTRETLHARTQELAAAPAGNRPATTQKLYEPKDVEREVSFARATVHKIAMPWSELFRELSASAVAGVSLLSIQPDPEGRVLRLSGQAETIPAMLTYVARLESNKYFPSVALVRHELKNEEPQRPVSFLVVATWSIRK